MRPGYFITFEGIDGTGKSTQARRLAEHLRESGRDVVLTREPGGSDGAEEIRRLVVEGEPGRWSPETELLLFTAARRDHVERVIEPALDAGKVVISDRFIDSTRAYQGTGDPARRRLVDRLHEMLIGREADLTVILDIDPDLAAHRTGGRTAEGGTDSAETRFEAKGFGFQARLRAAYAQIAAADPDRCAVIAADGEPEAVAARIRDVVVPRLPPLPA